MLSEAGVGPTPSQSQGPGYFWVCRMEDGLWEFGTGLDAGSGDVSLWASVGVLPDRDNVGEVFGVMPESEEKFELE